jgi:TonB family protein
VLKRPLLPAVAAAGAVALLAACTNPHGRQVPPDDWPVMTDDVTYMAEPWVPRLLPPADRTFVPPVPDAELQRHLRSKGLRAARLRFGYVDYWDYPNAALRDRHQGIAVIRVAVAPTGSVEGCEVTGSSGYSTLDAASCAIPARRFAYLPALGRGGRPIRETSTHRIVWRLPDDAWPTLIEEAPPPNFLQDEPPAA